MEGKGEKAEERDIKENGGGRDGVCASLCVWYLI